MHQSCFSEKELELYLLGEYEGLEAQKRIRDHLKKCVFCSRGLAALRTYYSLVDTIPSLKIIQMSDEVKNRIQSDALRADEYILTPYIHAPSDSYSLVADDANKRYSMVQSFIDHENGIIIRLIRDHIKNRTALFIIAGISTRHALVEFLNTPYTFLIQETGPTWLNDVDMEILLNTNVRIKLPLAEFDLRDTGGSSEKTHKLISSSSLSDELKIISKKKNRSTTALHIQIVTLKRPANMKNGKVGVLMKDGGFHTASVHNRTADVEHIKIEDVDQMFIY